MFFTHFIQSCQQRALFFYRFLMKPTTSSMKREEEDRKTKLEGQNRLAKREQRPPHKHQNRGHKLKC